VDQRNRWAEKSGPDNTELPEPLNATQFVQDALERWITSGMNYPLGVPVLVTLLLLQLVRDPTTVKVYVTTAVRSVTLEFDVEEADKGKIIGKGGHTIDAIRSLARSVAGASEREYQIYLIEGRDRD
jgi:hypothetical protein